MISTFLMDTQHEDSDLNSLFSSHVPVTSATFTEGGVSSPEKDRHDQWP